MNQVPGVIEQINSISFPFLRVLCIKHHQVVSVEPICHLNSPNLQYINLSNNLIVSLKPLCRSNFSGLKHLNVVQNKIVELARLSTMFSKHLQTLDIEVSQQLSQPLQNLNQIAKLQSQNFNILYVCSKKRIRTDKLSKVIKKRNPSTVLWDCVYDMKFNYYM